MSVLEAPTVAPADEETIQIPPAVHHRWNAEQMRTAIENTLKKVGCTYDELHQQSLDNDFVSWEARDAWLVISCFEPPETRTTD